MGGPTLLHPPIADAFGTSLPLYHSFNKPPSDRLTTTPPSWVSVALAQPATQGEKRVLPRPSQMGSYRVTSHVLHCTSHVSPLLTKEELLSCDSRENYTGIMCEMTDIWVDFLT